MLPHLEAVLAHLGAMFPISVTYVGSSCGYVCHIWDLCWIIWRASVRPSWRTFSAIAVGGCPTPMKCRLRLSVRLARRLREPIKTVVAWRVPEAHSQGSRQFPSPQLSTIDRSRRCLARRFHAQLPGPVAWQLRLVWPVPNACAGFQA